MNPKALPLRVHVTYSEPSGWSCPTLLHFPSIADAEWHIDAVASAIGPDAARRRNPAVRMRCSSI